MRLLQIIVVLFGISFITFGLTYMSPGDPVRNMYSANGVMPTEEMVEQTREEMGLNDPFFVQYGRWLGKFPVIETVGIFYAWYIHSCFKPAICLLSKSFSQTISF